MTRQPDTSDQGRIPYRLRIGVTGHRRLPEEEALAERVRRALQRIGELLPSSPYTPVLFTVISPLAEGADRLVAREVLKSEGADLEVPLPLPREEYLRDFQSDESNREFDGLLSRAREVTELGPSESREKAYESVGRYVVDRCDVLIALWDGEPSRGQGGTAEIVEYARGSQDRRQPESNPGRGPLTLVKNATEFMRRHGIFRRKPSSSSRQRPRVPLIWVSTKGRHQLIEEWGNGVDAMPFRQLDEYNRAKVTEERLDQQVGQHRNQLSVVGQRTDTSALPLGVISEWESPFYVRADLLAMRCQNWYYILSNALFLLAAAAVAAIAGQVVLAPDRLELVWIEVVLMLGVLLIVLIDRRWHFHARWISYRFLAERFRSAFFLAVAGVPGFREVSLDQVYLGHRSEEWLRRAFGEVWSRRPQAEFAESSVEDLRQFLTKAWIEDQTNFHRSAHRKYRFRHLRLSRITELLFGAAILAALLHATGVVEESSAGPLSWSDLLILLAISLPALGAAVSGIRAEREYLHNSDRYEEMIHHLEIIERRMQAGVDLEAVRTVAIDAENLMLQENRNWYVLMRPRRIEPG